MNKLCAIVVSVVAAVTAGVCLGGGTTWKGATSGSVQITDTGGIVASGTIVATGTVTAAGVVAGYFDTSSDAGTATGATTVVTERLGKVYETYITLTNKTIVITSNGLTTNDCGSTWLYAFPEGRIFVLGVVADNLRLATNGLRMATTNAAWFSVGTAAAAGADLTTTEVDLLPKTSAPRGTNITDAVLASEAQFDGTATAKAVYLNVLTSNALILATSTGKFSTGSIRINWLNLGDK